MFCKFPAYPIPCGLQKFWSMGKKLNNRGLSLGKCTSKVKNLKAYRIMEKPQKQ
jgi:hypothetical protein